MSVSKKENKITSVDQHEHLTQRKKPMGVGHKDNNEQESESHKKVGWAIYLRLLSYTRRYWFAFAAGVFGFIIYSSTAAATAEFVKYIIDAVEAGSDDMRNLAPILFIVLAVVRGFGGFLGNYGMTYVARNVVHALRLDIFDRLLLLPQQYYHDNPSGHTISKVTYDVEQVTGAAVNALKVVVREGFTVIALVAYLVYLNWKLSAILLIMAPLLGIVIGYSSRRFRKVSQRIQASMGDLTHIVSETVNAFQAVKVFGGEEYEKKRFATTSKYNLRQAMKMAVTTALSTPVVQLIVASVLALLIWLALRPEVTGGITPGEFVAYIMAAALLAKPMRQLTEVNAKIQRGIAASVSIFDLIDTETEVDSGRHIVDRVRGEIAFNNVFFQYPDTDNPVLHNVHLRVEAGKTIALVGRSGAGKSSLVSLIPRFFDATQGEILLDGVPLEDYELASLRRQIAIVSQKITLFNDTLHHNIAYGRLEDINEQAIIDAAKAARAWDFITQLPEGLETIVGQDGIQLSGGQRQRIAIARAILKDAPVLILDEATSALDSETEHEIQQALERLMVGRTTFVIAHRLSTVEKADVILVMDNGEIVESGSHEQLLKQGGQYARLYQRDMLDAADANSFEMDDDYD